MNSSDDVHKFREDLITKIKKIKIQNLISLSLVGSFMYAKKIESVNDIDLVVVVKKFTPESFRKLIGGFSSLGKSLSTPRLKFVVETRRGPFKPSPIKNKVIVQFHLIIYDDYIWRNKKSVTSTFEWVRFNKLLAGRPLRDITPKIKLTKEAILYDLNGLINNVKTNTAFTKYYGIKRNKVVETITRVKLSRSEYYDVLMYSVLMAFTNYARFLNPRVHINKENMPLHGERLLSPKYKKTLEKAIFLKKKMREGGFVSSSDISKFKKEAIEFINYLKNRVDQ
jgi:hypothetical protein